MVYLKLFRSQKRIQRQGAFLFLTVCCQNFNREVILNFIYEFAQVQKFIYEMLGNAKMTLLGKVCQPRFKCWKRAFESLHIIRENLKMSNLK